MKNGSVRSETVREHRAESPGALYTVRVTRGNISLEVYPERKADGRTTGAIPKGGVVLRGSQVRILRNLLNLAIEEEQS